MSDALDSLLPQGVHPRDQSAPWTPEMDANAPVGGDHGGPSSAGRRGKPWGTDNEEALGVYQRAAFAWHPVLVAVYPGNPTLIAGRQKGRTGLSLWVPNQVVVGGALITNPAGVLIGSDPEEAVTANVVLNVGDSCRIGTEGSAYAAVIPGTAVGYVQCIMEVNPPGGELGIY